MQNLPRDLMFLLRKIYSTLEHTNHRQRLARYVLPIHRGPIAGQRILSPERNVVH